MGDIDPEIWIRTWHTADSDDVYSTRKRLWTPRLDPKSFEEESMKSWEEVTRRPSTCSNSPLTCRPFWSFRHWRTDSSRTRLSNCREDTNWTRTPYWTVRRTQNTWTISTPQSSSILFENPEPEKTDREHQASSKPCVWNVVLSIFFKDHFFLKKRDVLMMWLLKNEEGKLDMTMKT